jgi:hypothetical protein
VSAVDDDGNDVAGVRLPDVAVPLASYTGWNLRHPDTGAPDELLLRSGATLRFPRTAAERTQTGDPRRSIEERYASKAFLERVRGEVAALVEERYLLEADIDPILEQAGLRWDLYSRASEPLQPLIDRASVLIADRRRTQLALAERTANCVLAVQQEDPRLIRRRRGRCRP